MSLRARFRALEQPLQLAVAVAAVILVVALVAGVVVGGAAVGTFFLESGDDAAGSAPAASFGATSTETGLTITHEDGDSVEAATLLVVADGVEKSWAARGDADGEVAPGDSLTLDVAAGTTVKLVYDGPSGRTTLGVFQA